MVPIGLLIAATVWGQPAAGRLLALDVAAGAAAWLLLALVPARPVLATLLMDALAAVSPAATPAATVGTLHTAMRRPLRLAVAVGAAGVAAHAARWPVRPTPGLSWGWWLVLIAVAHAALVGWGTLHQARAALIASLRERAARAEAEQHARVAEARGLERARIAREMHDVLAHRLSLLATFAGALEYRPDAPPEQLAKAAGVVRDGAHQALGELRDVLTVLRAAGDGAEPDGPQPVLADLPALLDEARAAGTPVELAGGVEDAAGLPPTLSRTVYRVIQEGLTNARKHAPGAPVRVALAGRPGDGLTVELTNPLTGGTAALPGSGTGLVGVAERVRLAGGAAEHGAAGGAFRLAARLPFPAAER
ncbi:sensor histidine kinase [Actinomadura sp. PM05-2]|uniref:histidine kinase n=2 Tax=Actinomadura parmotrematis TaxID=2864039 RepID=A0ABS7G2N6_9ACTN|nr:sensor histidine kinase [Actinomadura parmotrematis]